MSYWIYDPKKLVSPSSFIPYKQSKPGEIFNFLTVFLMLFTGYLHKTNQLDNNLNSVFFVFLTTFILGVVSGNEGDKNLKGDFVFGKYEDSLIIE